MTDVYTAALLLTKPSSDDHSGFSMVSSAVTHNTTWLCWIDVTLEDCHIHVDTVRALSWIFSIYVLLSNGESPRLVKNMKVKLVMKPWHLTSIGNTLIIQPFLTHRSHRSFYFSNLHWCAQLKFSSKITVNSITIIFPNSMD